MRTFGWCSLLFAFVFCAGTAPLAAQLNIEPRARTTGLMLGAHFGAVTVIIDGEAADPGVGVGGKVGFGLTPRWMIWAAGDYSDVSQEDVEFFPIGYTMTHLEAGARFHILNPRSARPWIPHISIGGGVRRLSGDVPIESEVPGSVRRRKSSASVLTAGVGVDYFINPGIAFAVDARAAFGEHAGRFEAGNIAARDRSVISGRVNVGLSWHPRIGNW